MDLLFYAGFRSDVVRNNAGGHYNHTLFWEILAPPVAHSEISQELSTAITNDFKSIDSLKKVLLNAASSRFGSGWAWLVLSPEKKLIVTSKKIVFFNKQKFFQLKKLNAHYHDI